MEQEGSMFAERLREDDLVLEESGRGSADGIGLLFDRFHKKIYCLARFILKDDIEGQEVTKEVFLTVIRKAATHRGTSDIATWLFRICVRLCLKRLGKIGERDTTPSIEKYLPLFSKGGLHADPVDDWSEALRQQLGNKEFAGLIRKFTDGLSENDRVIFALREIAGLSAEETATLLGISVRMVKWDLHRTWLYVRGQLAGYMTQVGNCPNGPAGN